MTASPDWRAAGEAWGRTARDWAYLYEPGARRANEALFDALDVGAGTSVLDVACGSGFAASLAAERGAAMAGLDASGQLVAIALRFCGRRGGTGGASGRPGGHHVLGATEAGGPDAVFRDCRLAVAALTCRRDVVPRGHRPPRCGRGHVSGGGSRRGTTRIGEGDPRMARPRPRGAGVDGGRPVGPALEAVGAEAFRAALRDALAPLLVREVGLRITSEFGWITGRRGG